MSDSYTEVSYKSPFSRVADSFKGMLVGFVLCVIAPVGLWFNEKDAVDTAAALAEGASKVVTVPATTKDASGTQKLVHVTGKATTSETLKDPDFAISANALRITRTVEMYQWVQKVEEKKSDTISGSEKTEKKYSYKMDWEDEPIDSTKFKIQEGHQNPAMPLRSLKQVATDVKLGEFKMSEALVGMIHGETPLSMTPEIVATFPPELAGQYQAANGELHTGNASSPMIGDLKVKFTVTNQQDVSVVSGSTNNDFSPWMASNGKPLQFLHPGIHESGPMFKKEQDSNVMWTWIWRFVGFLVMWIGIGMILGPISTIARSVPLLGMLMGGAVGAGVGLLSFGIAAVLTSVVIAAAWFAARPMLSIGLVVGALVLLFAARTMRSGSGKAA